MGLLLLAATGIAALRPPNILVILADDLGDEPDLKDGELYHLARNLGEQHNLAQAEPEKVKELAAAWSCWNSELVEPKWYHPLPKDKKAAKDPEE